MRLVTVFKDRIVKWAVLRTSLSTFLAIYLWKPLKLSENLWEVLGSLPLCPVPLYEDQILTPTPNPPEFLTKVATPPACYRSISGPKGPECPGSVPRGVSGALRAPGSGVSKKCPESVLGVSKRCPGHSGDTLGTLFGHSGAQGAKGPRDTPRDTPGTLRAWRAWETPVAGRGGCNTKDFPSASRSRLEILIEENLVGEKSCSYYNFQDFKIALLCLVFYSKQQEIPGIPGTLLCPAGCFRDTWPFRQLS